MVDSPSLDINAGDLGTIMFSQNSEFDGTSPSCGLQDCLYVLCRKHPLTATEKETEEVKPVDLPEDSLVIGFRIASNAICND